MDERNENEVENFMNLFHFVVVYFIDEMNNKRIQIIPEMEET